MPTLMSKVKDLADTFAEGVLAAVRFASLEDILSGGAAAPARRAVAARGGGGQPDPLKTPKKGKRGRLARRSAKDIEHVIGLVVAKLKEHTAGLRSEQLQKVLKLSKAEITRPLGAALAAKKIAKKGQRRSTVYFAK